MNKTIIIDSMQRKTWAIENIHMLPLDQIYAVNIREHEDTRSKAQNRLMWDMLTEIANQVEWHGQKLSPEDWKDMITAALKAQRVVPGIEGGFVVLGARTSKMTIKEMNLVIEFCEHFGGANGVKFKTTVEGYE